jgi:hypothetical protein
VIRVVAIGEKQLPDLQYCFVFGYRVLELLNYTVSARSQSDVRIDLLTIQFLNIHCNVLGTIDWCSPGHMIFIL